MPAIVVNGSDNINAQAFTILHELGHLILGARGSGQLMEIWCNQFASEVLVPSNELKEFISGYPQIHDSELVEMIAANFAVSRLCAFVCLARFRDIKWSDRPNYFADSPKEKSEKQSKEGGGPDRTKVLASKLPFMLKLIFRT